MKEFRLWLLTLIVCFAVILVAISYYQVTRKQIALHEITIKNGGRCRLDIGNDFLPFRVNLEDR